MSATLAFRVPDLADASKNPLDYSVEFTPILKSWTLKLVDSDVSTIITESEALAWIREQSADPRSGSPLHSLYHGVGIRRTYLPGSKRAQYSAEGFGSHRRLKDLRKLIDYRRQNKE